ncbi:MAG: TrkH family potassium uptake protein [Clostridia bacterium]|nr:TrkH family potassium uptake protein [Clostridia bacterium]
MTRNTKGILKIFGRLLVVTGMALLVPGIMAALEGELVYMQAFLAPSAIALTIGALLACSYRKAGAKLSSKDGMLIAAITWIGASLIGTIPYLAGGITTSFMAAIFESISAFTTTGATVFEDVSALPACYLIWRSLSQWLGGLGVIVLLSSLMLSAAGGTARLLHADISGISNTKVALSKNAATFVYGIYTGFTILEVLLLKLGGLNWMDSIVFSCSTVSTGGLTNYTSGLAAVSTQYIAMVLGIFMVISGLDYTLFYRGFKGERGFFGRNSEVKAYFGIMFAAAALIAVNLSATGTVSDDEAISQGLFNTISYMTTTGISVGNPDAWPTFSKILLTVLSFVGSCSSSTGGALKVIRIVVLSKLIWRSFTTRIHPQAVIAVKVSGKPLKSNASNRIVYYLLTYTVVLFAGIFLLSFDAPDMQTAITSAAAALNNIGRGFGAMGVCANYSSFTGFSQAVLCALMLLGRLEIYTLLLLLNRDFWKEKI